MELPGRVKVVALSPDLEELRVKGLRALARCMPTDEGSAAGGCTCCPYGGRMTACVTICVEAMEDIRRLLEALGKEDAL